MRRAWIVLSVLIGGCSLFAPQPMPARPAGPGAPPEIVPPPAMSLNGVDGRPVTWCWETACVDGTAPPPDQLPAVTPPFEIVLPAGARIEEVMAYHDAELSGRGVRVAWADNAILAVPAGTVSISVFLTLAPSGDAVYFWAVEE